MGLTTLRGAPLALVLVAAMAGCADEPAADPTTVTTGETTRVLTTLPATPTSAPTPSAPAHECTSQRTASRAAAPVWLLNTTYGDIRVVLFCDKMPVTAQNIVTLTERAFYDGILFHRVVQGFVIQAGDPQTKNESLRERWGTGGAGYTIADEFYCSDGTMSYDYPAFCPDGVGLHHDGPGIVSMANSGQAHTGSSQFFITTSAARELDEKHPIFGQVADQTSLNVVAAIDRAPTNKPYSDLPRSPIVIERAIIEWS